MKNLLFLLLLFGCCKDDMQSWTCTKSYVKHSHEALWQYGIAFQIQMVGSEKQIRAFESLHSQNDTLVDAEGYPTIFDYDCYCE